MIFFVEMEDGNCAADQSDRLNQLNELIKVFRRTDQEKKIRFFVDDVFCFFC